MVEVWNGGGEAASSKAVNHLHADPVRVEDGAQASTLKTSNLPEDRPPSKSASKASCRRNSPQAAANSDLRQPMQASGSTPSATEPPPQSQPMTATNSTSSHASAKDSKDAKEPAAAPYGTRSRNRPGTSRVNYAEDVEMDFEMAHASTNEIATEMTSGGSLGAGGAPSSAVGGKKGANAGQSNVAWGVTGASSKDQPPNLNIPGTSTFAANPHTGAAHPPKRRKNAASHATNGTQNASGTQAGSAAPSHSKRGTNNPGINAMVAAANYARESNMMTFSNRKGAFVIDGRLESDDGRTVSVNDHVYLVCEPPGDPYYLCRVMEFIHVDGNPQSRVEALRVNWYYRPRDVQRYANDTRLVYATMHSDICPITSLRGRCQILHRSEINNLDDYRKQPDSFWFNQCFDRFIHRWYDVIPTSQVTNVPDKVKKALDERWKYICLETSRVKELTSAVKTCKRCVGFCANNDSVECAHCHNTYHMNCLRPPLPKKPARGFAWSCAPCSRAQEKKLEARRTPLLGSGNEDGDDDEGLDEEEEDAAVDTTAPSPEPETEVDQHPGTQAEIALAKMWPMRYLGIHCRVEDALQYDDRAIYPRASSRLGPRHQANVNVWHGRPVELVKSAEIKKRYVKGSSHKKDAKLTKETIAAIEADKAEKAKRPKWVMDEPPGYVHRGEDHPNKDSKCTAELQFKMPPLGVHSTRGGDDPSVTPEQIEAYMKRARALAKDVGVQPYQTDFLDKCLNLFMKTNYDAEAALKQVKKIDKRKDLKIPELTKEEERKWNEGVAKYGSEIRSVRLHVKTIGYADATRHYYMWKKTPKGREIWGSYSNRKGKLKQAAEATETKLLDDVADDVDDSAFDTEKAMQRKRGFQCKFCSSRHSRQWRRAPGVSPGQTVAADGRASKANSTGYVLALCQRCANLWRKYAVKWENTDEIAKKVAQGGGKAWKRRIDEELLREVYAATNGTNGTNNAPDYGDTPYASATPVSEPPKKKQKMTAPGDSGASTPALEPAIKKKEKPPPQPKAPTPPPVPAQPRLKILPCAVCRQLDGPRLECAACRLTVHKSCYGVEESRQTKWFCDMCKNDKKESVSYTYECVLCPHKVTDQELYEPPKISHKKKTDREREKERMERELVDKAREEYRQKQIDKGRPVVPREPLKRTADNNWVHVHCALWVPETRFTKPNKLDMVEGVGAPTVRYDLVCKICKTTHGACVSCHQCHANFHVGCAHSAGYTFGFDITPVKATRRDTVPTVTLNGETGAMTAAIWCKEHAPKTIVHRMNEEVEGTGLVALQLFAKQYKQADLLLTGTARKANLVDQSARAGPQLTAAHQNGRRTSTVASHVPTSGRGRASNAGLAARQDDGDNMAGPTRTCTKCKVDVSPMWWKVEMEPSPSHRTAAEDSDASAPANGIQANGVQTNGHASHSHPNGSIDHIMNDAPSIVPQEQGARHRTESDASVARSAFYLCQKCHWKKRNGKEDTPEKEKTPQPSPEPQQLPVRSPPAQPQPPVPQTLAPPWQPNGPPPPPPHAHQPPMAVWPHPGPPLLNGIGHPPLGHPPPVYAPYTPLHHPSGYPPYSGPPLHQAISPVPLRGHYPHPPPPPPGGAPPPSGMHMNGTALVVNGVHSPHIGYPHPHAPPRASESPFSGPPSMGQYTLHHNNPPLGNRPSTPRDAPMTTPTSLPAPAAPAPPEPRPEPRAGASASPSLHNLLS